jgi:uncharacterized protein (DUF302 family)
MSRVLLSTIGLSTALLVGGTLVASARPVDEVLVKPSTRGVKESIDALAQAVEAAGAKVVARVDHAAGAKATGAEMKPMEVLIFGNPKLGTPLIQANPRAGLDLPMKVLAYEDAAGKVWIVTTRPSALKTRYGIKGRDEVITAMSGALDKLTGAAAGVPAAAPAAPAKK